MTPTDLVNIMFRASQAQHGLLLRVSHPGRAMQAFARAREDHPDAELPPVRFRELAGHPEGNLVILRGARGAAGAQSEGDLF
jgi:hypothetical protein